jgi:hypothetical protein
LKQAFLLRPEVDFDARFGKPPDVQPRVAVDTDGSDSSPDERERGGAAGPC